jgi:AraC-like DNA-binding protein
VIEAAIEGRWLHRVGGAVRDVRIPPDGCVDLIVRVEAGVVTPYVYGPTDAYDDVTLPVGILIAGVRFRAGVGPLALDVRGAELAGRSIALDDIAPRAARLLRDVEPTPAGLRARLDDVAAMLAAAARPHREHERAARAVAAIAGGAERVSTIARDLGASERTLHRDFLLAVGLAPKVFARVARARRAAEALAAGAPPGDTAFACGYADQAHLTRELVALHGITPARVRNLQD